MLANINFMLRTFFTSLTKNKNFTTAPLRSTEGMLNFFKRVVTLHIMENKILLFCDWLRIKFWLWRTLSYVSLYTTYRISSDWDLKSINQCIYVWRVDRSGMEMLEDCFLKLSFDCKKPYLLYITNYIYYYY